MKKVRLTNTRIANVNIGGHTSSTGKPLNQIFIWDTEAKGLGVRVTSRSKSFIFQGKVNKLTTIRKTIGSCNSWTLEDARKEARRIQPLLDQGIDPRALEATKKAENEAKKAAIEAGRKYTLNALLQAYTDHLEARGKVKSAAGARTTIKNHILAVDSAIAEKPARDLTSLEIAALIRRTWEKGKERTAGILRSIISAAYNCARRAPFDTELPSVFIQFEIDKNPVDAIPAIPVKARNHVLTHSELKNYIDALGDSTVDLALKLTLYAGGQRMAQVLRAEIPDWNPDTQILRLCDPKGKRRQPREHLLPLGPLASSIANELAARAEGFKTNRLFHSATKKTGIHDTTIGPRVSEIAKKIGSEPFDLRDIRRTVETELAALGVSRDIRAQLLSHGISGVQAQHYDRHDYLKEKRLALRKWEQHLSRILTGEQEQKIVRLRG